MFQIRSLVSTLILVTAALAQPQSGKLKMAVIVTRHGVRPPLSNDTSSPYARDIWPSLTEWGARCPGDLTPTGYNLAKLIGRYYSDHYIGKGLLPNSCPDQKTYIWADNEERTMETSKALAQGLAQRFPGCSVPVNSLPYFAPDQQCKSKEKPETDCFFHPQSCDAIKKNIEPDRMTAFAAKIEQEAPGLRKQYGVELAALENVILCCDSTAKECPSNGACTLPTLQDKVTLGDDKSP
jgi:histidine phosphatase superfamily protein (branch 2)